MNLNLIFNRSQQSVIGINNQLLVSISDDLKWFRKLTEKNLIVMGYNTFQSLPGGNDFNPLKDRLNIVISNKHYSKIVTAIRNYKYTNVIVYKSFEDFYNEWFLNKKVFSNEEYLSHYKNTKDVFIIGGGQLYSHVIQNYKVNTIYETRNNYTIDIEGISLNNQITYFDYPIPRDVYTQTFLKQKRSRVRCKHDLIGEKAFDSQKDVEYSFIIYQNNEDINNGEMEYLNLLKNIYFDGKARDSRNSKVLSIFSPPSMRFDIRKGFPLLTSKKMPWKIVLRELLWFIRGDTSNKKLQEKNVHIWDDNSTKEYMESRGLGHYIDGDLGPIYGFQWRHFGAKYYGCNSDHSGRGFDQLNYIINEIKNNPTSRRIILNSWNAADIDQMALPPCHVLVQFYVDVQENCIDAKLYQRSGDMFLGIPFNISSYAMLLSIIGNITGYTPRYFIHDIGDAHIYDNHKESIEEQLIKRTYSFPKFIIRQKIQSIDEIDEDMFEVKDYQCNQVIKAKMIT